MRNKKAVSLMISYVILVTIAIIMSIVVFSYLKVVSNVEPVVDCKEGTSMIVDDYLCEPGKVTLTLRNNGRFSIDGFIPLFGAEVDRVSDINLLTRTQPNLASLTAELPPMDPPRFKEKLSPGGIISVEFTNIEKKGNGLEVEIASEFLRNLRIQPYIIDEESDLRIVCTESIIKQSLENCNVK